MRKRTMHRPCVTKNFMTTSLASGARFRYRWVPSELCPSDEASRWCGREQEVLEENPREPTFTSERRSPQHGTPQRSGEWVRATRRARKAAQDHTFGTSVGLVVNTDSTRSHLEQASVKSTTLHAYRHHCAEWMRWCRQSQKNLSTPMSLEMAMIQYFNHLFFKGSPSGIGRTVLATVCHCRPDWVLCLRSDVGRIKQALKGWERLAPGNSKDPLPWILVLALASELNQHGHFEMSTATLLATDAYLRPGEIESLKGDSLVLPRQEAGAPFDQWALHLFPREGGIAIKTQQHDGTISLDSSSRPWLGPLVNLTAKTRKKDEKLFSFTIDAWRKQLRAAAQRLGYLDITPHVMRHSGPSNDRALHCLTLEEVQKRRRWLASTSLRRCEKSARLSRLVADLPAQALAKIQEHARKVPANLMPASLNERNVKRAPPKPLQRRRGSPHFKALKGRTAVVLMDAGAPFAKALQCFGLVVHSCPLETLRLPQARDRISSVCRESSFVVYATLPLTCIDGVLAVRDSHGKPWPDTSSRTKGRCRTEGRIFAWVATLWRYLSLQRVPQHFVTSAKCSLWSNNSIQRAFESTKATLVWHDSYQHGTRFKSTFFVACANLLNVPDNSLCVAPHSSCRQSHRSHLHLPFRCLLSQPPPSDLAILFAASVVNQILNGNFSSVWSVLNEAAVGQQHS